MRYGYIGWRFQPLCGATPAFPWAATRVAMQCSVALENEVAWWRASLRVLEQLSSQHPGLDHWLHCTQGLLEADDACPLQMGLESLQVALGCPRYPARLCLDDVRQTGKDPDPADVNGLRHLVLYLGSPYGEFVRRALQLSGLWLAWGNAALQQGRLELSREQVQRWCAEIDRLPALLPAQSLMGMHHGLWLQGISWEWLGEDRTRIGEGARQQVVSGLAQNLPLQDPEAWRVPIYTVTGSVGKTTTARLLWQLLQHSCEALALTASDGAWVGHQRVAKGDCIGGITAQALLKSPAVKAAVFEQGRGGIVRQGVPYARSDVAILLNVQPVHLGVDGIETLEQMADTKAIGLRPARLWVLNHDDSQCLRLADQHPAQATVWFSVSATCQNLQYLSLGAQAAVGVERDVEGAPRAIILWQAGRLIEHWSLEGVAPYHGFLGDKTLEELLAAVAAAYFGPIQPAAAHWQQWLRALRLDANNHAFRTSVHHQGRVVFVLDKAGELASMRTLQGPVEELALREGCTHRIVALCRSAGEVPERHLESVNALHVFMDEFVCFDRPDTYTSKVALPIYSPGSIPVLVRDEVLRLNAEKKVSKLAKVVDDWTQAEAYLRERLRELPGKTLVLINQPSTAAAELNQKILTFATDGLSELGVNAGRESQAHD